MQSKGGKIGEPQATCGGPVKAAGAYSFRERTTLWTGSAGTMAVVPVSPTCDYRGILSTVLYVGTTCPVRGKELR